MSAARDQIGGAGTLLREDARSWGVSPRDAVLLFLVPLVGLVVVTASRVHLPTFQLITAEDRLLEWLQFFVYGAGAVLALLLARRLAALRETRFAVAYGVLAVGLVFICGEEISWGQRILGVETPESLEELNGQGEIGVHNIGTIETIFQLGLLTAGAYGSFGAWYLRSRRRELGPRVLALFVPPLFLSSFFLVLFAHRLVRFTVPVATDVTTFVKIGEWPELCFASVIAIFCALNLRSLKDPA